MGNESPVISPRPASVWAIHFAWRPFYRIVARHESVVDPGLPSRPANLSCSQRRRQPSPAPLPLPLTPRPGLARRRPSRASPSVWANERSSPRPTTTKWRSRPTRFRTAQSHLPATALYHSLLSPLSRRQRQSTSMAWSSRFILGGASNVTCLNRLAICRSGVRAPYPPPSSGVRTCEWPLPRLRLRRGRRAVSERTPSDRRGTKGHFPASPVAQPWHKPSALRLNSRAFMLLWPRSAPSGEASPRPLAHPHRSNNPSHRSAPAPSSPRPG